MRKFSLAIIMLLKKWKKLKYINQKVGFITIT